MPEMKPIETARRLITVAAFASLIPLLGACETGAARTAGPMATDSVEEPAVAEIQEAMAAEAAAAMRPDPTQQTLRSLQTQVDGLMTEVDLLKRQIRQLQSN
jgi:hypothetical protein